MSGQFYLDLDLKFPNEFISVGILIYLNELRMEW